MKKSKIDCVYEDEFIKIINKNGKILHILKHVENIHQIKHRYNPHAYDELIMKTQKN